MPYAFQKMQLQADSLYALIADWTDLQLEVTDEAAVITGYGFAPDIAQAFTTLILDWEARIIVSKDDLGLPKGSYELTRSDKKPVACRNQQKFVVADLPAVVEVEAVSEEILGVTPETKE